MLKALNDSRAPRTIDVQCDHLSKERDALPILLSNLRMWPPLDLDEQSSDPVGRSFAQAQLALYTVHTDEVPTNRCPLVTSDLGGFFGGLLAGCGLMPRRLTPRRENPFIESTIYFFASTADAEGRSTRFTRQT